MLLLARTSGQYTTCQLVVRDKMISAAGLGDGFMRQTIHRGQSAHDPNTVSQGLPQQAKMSAGGFASYAERIDAANGAGVTFLEKARIGAAIDEKDSAVIADVNLPAKKTASAFVEAIRQHRNWKREAKTLPTG